MSKATTIGDIVALEAELSRRQADLEALQARQRTLADQTAQATVTVRLYDADAPAPVQEQTGLPRRPVRRVGRLHGRHGRGADGARRAACRSCSCSRRSLWSCGCSSAAPGVVTPRRRPSTPRDLGEHGTVARPHRGRTRRRVAASARYGRRVSGLPDYFDEAVAATYDEDDSEEFSPATIARTVDVLEELADGGRALELAIGTGRIAVPLSARGVPVAGIDLSAAMVSRLHAKAGGASIPVTIGDIATTRVEGTFSLAYLVFNTIMNLTTQDAQVACFRNAAEHLDPGGAFVIECLVPELRRLPPGSTVVPFHVGATRWGFDEYDVAEQRVVSHHVHLEEGIGRQVSIPFRYVWPAELDLMARLAGLALVHRWQDWSREQFTHESRGHVTMWRKPGV